MVLKLDRFDLGISKLGNDERGYGSRLILPILYNTWIFSWEINFTFGNRT